ncbi:MAG: PKD domain-containing protein [Kiritimatiellae bacterium]|nr:PKD domain-containing protein [Kiritimatiellia bacterium]
MSNETGASVSSVEGLPLGAWKHLSGVFDGSVLSIYVDGVLKDSSSFPGGLKQTTSPLNIGCDYNNPGSFFNGGIDEVRIYNRALSSNEINQLYVQTAPLTVNTQPATGITTNSAILNGNLISGGGTNNAFVVIYWGPSDGGTNIGSWSNTLWFGWLNAGPFSTNITGLVSNTTYFYRCYASNAFGTAWAPSTTNFTTWPYDSDGDGMPDWWEVAHGLNRLANDASGDPDVDGYSNLAEWQGRSDPQDLASLPDGRFLWVTQIGSASDSESANRVVATTNAIHVIGQFGFTTTFAVGDPAATNLSSSANSRDCYLAKYSPSGTLQWLRHMESEDLDNVYDIAFGATGDIALCGQFGHSVATSVTMTLGAGESNETNLASVGYADMWTARYTADGRVVWAKSAGGSDYDSAYVAGILSDGSVVMAGGFKATASFGEGAQTTNLTADGGIDICLAMYGPDGTLRWVQKGGGTDDDDRPVGLTVLPDDSVLIAAYFGTTGWFGMGPDLTNLVAGGDADGLLAKYAPDGRLVWLHQIGGSGLAGVNASAILADGSILAVGGFTETASFGQIGTNSVTLTSAGANDVFIMKLDGGGDPCWVRRAGGSSNDACFSVAAFADGSFAISGFFAGTATFGPGEAQETALNSAGNLDVYFARYDANGNLMWARSNGAGDQDTEGHVAVDEDGGLLVTGGYQGSVLFGQGEPNQTNRTSLGWLDAFVAKYQCALGPTVSLSVEGTPARRGLPTPTPYGTHAVPQGINLTESVKSPCDGPYGTRYVCSGWVGTGSVPAQGFTNVCTFQAVSNSTLTWQWVTEFMVDNGGGSSNITQNAALLCGNLNFTGVPPTTVTIFWGPTDGGTNTVAWTNICEFGALTIGPFSTNVTGLASNTTYYYRCYASNAFGTAWAPSATNFVTAGVPTLAINNDGGALDVTSNSATLNGNLASGGGTNGADIVIYWGTSDGGTNKGAWVENIYLGWRGTGLFSTNIFGLLSGTTYYYRCFASNSFGTAWAPSTTNFTTFIARSLTVSSAHGTPAPPVGVQNYSDGTFIACSNSALVTVGGTQYVCTGWAGGGSVPANGSSNMVGFVLSADSLITWEWATNYMLIVNSSGFGSVDVGSDWFADGSNVTITATPSNSSHFVNWTGDTAGCTPSGNQITAPMTQTRSITANFSINLYDIVVSAGSNGTINPAGTVQVAHGGQTNFLIQATGGAHIAEVMVDGVSTGWFGPGSNLVTYVFNNVVTGHTITASFNTAPVLHMTAAPTSGVAPLMVAFDFGGSVDAQNNIARCEVDRETDNKVDAFIEQVGKVLVEYGRPGVYTTALHVVDGYGLIDATNLIITVYGAAPVAVIGASVTNGTAPFSVQFNGTNSTCAVGRQIVLYEWDVQGDGIYDLQTHTGLVSWVYGNSGTNFAKLRVTDSEGLQDIASILITVQPPVLIPPTFSNLAALPASGDLPLMVQFTATASDDGSIVEYGWDFNGDGQRDRITTSNTASYLYEVVGTHTAIVTVVDNDGLSALASVAVAVVERQTWKVWITQPIQGTNDVPHISGNAVSVIGHVAPANDTISVQFQYKLETAGTWLDLGPVIYPQPRAYKTTWNVTGLENESNYNLRAVATVDLGQTATSDVYMVTIDTGSTNKEDNTSGTHAMTQACNKDETTAVKLYDGTEVLIPEGTVNTNPIITVVVTGGNSNGVNGSADGLANIAANRTISLVDDPELGKSITITIPYSDTNNDGIVDGTTVPEDSLTAHWYDTSTGKWYRALSTEIDTEANVVKVTTYHLTEFGLFGTLNLLHPANGGELKSYTSQNSASKAAANLTDGNRHSFWQSAALPVGDQTFVFGFTNNQGAIIAEAVLYNFGQADEGQTNYCRDFTLASSMDDSTYLPITNGTLAAVETPQTFSFGAVTCRTVRLVIHDGYSTQSWNLAEFELHGSITNDPDSDGLPDWWEMQYFGHFGNSGTNHSDEDSLNDQTEFNLGSNPLSADTDGDGMTDGDEYIAGTAITNAASRLGLQGSLLLGYYSDTVYWDITNLVWCTQSTFTAESLVFDWQTVVGRLYRIYNTTNLLGGTSSWNCVAGPITGDGSNVSYTNSITDTERGFYRLGVELP